nr:reverse transcriptase domain-containing protein [Tanacetum cinerariifolium]
MRTRNSYFPNNSSATIPRRRNKRRTPNVVEPELCTIVEMADNHTMEELVQAPTKGYGEAIVIPEINADHFEIKTNLIQLVQANPYHGFERENPHTYINNFKRITSTLKFRDVPNDVIKLMMFLYSFEENARVWNTIPNPKGEMKAITTWSGVAYEGPLIPKKVVKQETEETTDKEQSNFQGSNAHIQPPAIPILKLDKKISLPELTPTQMTLELADRFITRPKGVAEDVFVKVEKFHFLTDFVVVDFEADPCVPLILGRSFLRTGRALIDVYGEEITLRVNDEAVTFNLNQTMRYSSTYDDLSVNRIDIIDVPRKEYVQEILGFSSNSSGGSLTFTFEPILFESSPSLTPFEGKIDHADYDPEGDICLIEKLLNDDPFQLSPMDLKEVIKAKSSIEEPPKVELKYLLSHLEYAYLEENDKLPVIISKDLKDDEKEALLNVLKSHKRATARKITDIKGIDPRFFTHKLLMDEDFKPSVQSQRRVNPKIHEVIKKEVLKLLDAGMIYPISNSPWVSPIHCVPKKRGITMVANEENELISARLVTGWRVCIDYRKLNEATRKDHFSLPFMDQIPMTHLLENETPFMFSKDCIDAFETLKKKLTEALILGIPNWNLPFELMCDASDFAIGAVLGQ